MKYITILKVEPSDLCEWVKETSQNGLKEPDIIVNICDLNYETPYIRVADVYDDTGGIIKERCTPITVLDLTEWTAFDNLSYDDEMGLMW